MSHDVGDAATAIDGTGRDASTGVRALPETVRAAHALADALSGALRDFPNQRPLVVGGDCSILFGILPALRRTVGPVGLWFLDGHPDYLDGPHSETGETADMDLAVLTGVGADPLVALAGEAPMLALSDTVLLGHRTQDLASGAQYELDRLPADLRRIDALRLVRDPAGAGRRAASWLADAGNGVWLHLDLDVLDPTALPAVTYPQAGGPDWDQLATVLRPLTRSPRLLGVSVADLRPDLDPTGALTTRVVGLLERVLP